MAINFAPAEHQFSPKKNFAYRGGAYKSTEIYTKKLRFMDSG